MTGFERVIQIIASILTIVNFIIVFFNLFIPATIDNPFSSIPFINRVVLFILLECSLAFIFGYIFSLIYQMKLYMQIFYYFILTVMSAWISIWNVKGILFLNIEIIFNSKLNIIFSIVLLVAMVINLIFIISHFNKLLTIQKKEEPSCPYESDYITGYETKINESDWYGEPIKIPKISPEYAIDLSKYNNFQKLISNIDRNKYLVSFLQVTSFLGLYMLLFLKS